MCGRVHTKPLVITFVAPSAFKPSSLLSRKRQPAALFISNMRDAKSILALDPKSALALLEPSIIFTIFCHILPAVLMHSCSSCSTLAVVASHLPVVGFFVRLLPLENVNSVLTIIYAVVYWIPFAALRKLYVAFTKRRRVTIHRNHAPKFVKPGRAVRA